MSRFQRMVAVPESEYLQLTSLQQVKQPLAQKFYEVNNEYENAAAISDPYSRLAVRSTTLNEMKSLHDQMKNYLSIVTPKPYRSRAERLLSVLEPHLKWNEKGEMIDNSTNRAIDQSQVSDLIQHAVRDRRRRNMSPMGWEKFVERLREHNAPQMLLSMETLNEMKAKPSKTTTPVDVPEAAAAPITPVRQKRKAKRQIPTESIKRGRRSHSLPKRLHDYFPYMYEKK